MNEHEVRSEKAKSKKIDSIYLMGTIAHHGMGDISSVNPDLLIAHHESDDYYIGNWVTGFGFIDVCFPKETTRHLTPEEVEKYNKKYVQLADYEPVKLKVD